MIQFTTLLIYLLFAVTWVPVRQREKGRGEGFKNTQNGSKSINEISYLNHSANAFIKIWIKYSHLMNLSVGTMILMGFKIHNRILLKIKLSTFQFFPLFYIETYYNTYPTLPGFYAFSFPPKEQWQIRKSTVSFC